MKLHFRDKCKRAVIATLYEETHKELPMQLFTSLSQIDALPASDLKTHLQARHRALYEDDMGPVFVVVEQDDDIAGPDYAFVSGRCRRSTSRSQMGTYRAGTRRPESTTAIINISRDTSLQLQ